MRWYHYGLIIEVFVFIVLLYQIGKSRAKTFQTSASQESMNFLSNILILLALFVFFFAVWFLPISLIYTFYFDACTIAYGKVPDWEMPLYLNLLTITICLSASWLLARRTESMFLLNGALGTKLIGREQTGKGHIATKWLVFFVPLIPICSYEVLNEQHGLHDRTYYSMNPLPTLAKEQIKKTYRSSLFWYFFILFIIIGFALLGTWKCF